MDGPDVAFNGKIFVSRARRQKKIDDYSLNEFKIFKIILSIEPINLHPHIVPHVVVVIKKEFFFLQKAPCVFRKPQKGPSILRFY